MDEGEVHVSGGMHAQVHDRICICSKCGYKMVKDEDVACGFQSCPRCGRTLMRL